MFDIIEQAHASELHCHADPDTGLRAIIAIHNTRLGPALGGCRCLPYQTEETAIHDAIRLAKGMSYKAALADVPQGGGKSVLIQPKKIVDRERYFEAFGSFVETLQGRYITAVDSGTSMNDMDAIAHTTRYVSGTHQDHCDPSPNTARGVLNGIEAAAAFQLKRRSLEGLHIAIQGVGHVGHALARLATDAGATLTVADLDPEKTSRCADELGAAVVSVEGIHRTRCDIYAPCGLGGILNSNTIPELQCQIVAGSANNQLACPEDARRLHDRGILYAPDYVINAGGLILVSLNHLNQSHRVAEKTENIARTLLNIFEEARRRNCSPAVLADELAEQRLYH